MSGLWTDLHPKCWKGSFQFDDNSPSLWISLLLIQTLVTFTTTFLGLVTCTFVVMQLPLPIIPSYKGISINIPHLFNATLLYFCFNLVCLGLRYRLSSLQERDNCFKIAALLTTKSAVQTDDPYLSLHLNLAKFECESASFKMRYARVSNVITALNTIHFRGLWTEIILHLKKIKTTEHMVHYRRELDASFDDCVDGLVEKWASYPKVKAVIEFELKIRDICDRVARWLSDRLERPSKAWYESSARAKFLSAFEIIRFRRNSAVAITKTSDMTEEKQLNLAKEYVADIMFKTMLCKDFEKTDGCKFGDICMFAHGRDELRTTESNLKKCMVENKGFVISEYAYKTLANEYQKIADEAQRKPEVAVVERKRSVVERRLSEMKAFEEPVARSKIRRNTVLDTVYMSQFNASVHNGVDTLDTSQLNAKKKANFDEDASVQDGGGLEVFWIISFLRALASSHIFRQLLWCTPSPGAVDCNAGISKEIEELLEEVDRRILSNFVCRQPMWFISCWYCPDILWKEKGNFGRARMRMIHFFLIVIWALMHGLGITAVVITRLQDGLTIGEGIWSISLYGIVLFYIVAVPMYSFLLAIAAYIVTHSLRRVIYTMEKKEIQEVQLAFLEPSDDGAEKIPKEEPLVALNKDSNPDSIFRYAAADVELKKEEPKMMSNSEQLLRNALSPDLSTARLPPLGQAAPTLSPLQGVAVLPKLPWTKNMLDLEQSIEDEERKVKIFSRHLEQLHSAEVMRQDVLKMLELSVRKGDPQKDLASGNVSTNEGEEDGGKEESSDHSAESNRQQDVLKTLEISVGEEGSHKDPADDNVSTNKGEEDGGKEVLPEKVLKPSSTKAKPKKKESIPDAVKRKEKLELLRSAQKKRKKVLKILDDSVGRPNKNTETANVHITNENEGPTSIPTSSDKAKMKEIVARIEEIDSKTKLVHDKQKKLEGQAVFLRGELQKIKDGFESPHVKEHRKREAQVYGTSEQKMEMSGESTPEIGQQKQHDSSASVQGQNTPERENLLSEFESYSQGTSEEKMEISDEATPTPEMDQPKQYHSNDNNSSVQRQDTPERRELLSKLESCSSQNSETRELIALDGLHLDHFAQSKLGSPLFRSLAGMMDSAENTGDYEYNKKKL